MSESLSQNEVDLLFGSGGQSEVTRQDEADVELYDFSKPARISKDRNRSLMAMYGMLVKSIESWLAGRVRDQIEVELQSVEQITAGEFILALPSPCVSFVMDVENAQRQAVIDFGHELAYYLTDRLLGGSGRHEVPARPLTALEQKVVEIVATRVAGLLGEAWKDYVTLGLEVRTFESIPEMLRIANREDPVLVANVVVSAGEMSSLMVLCLPFNTVEKFFTGTSGRRPEEPQGTPEERILDRELIETTVRDTRVVVGARLPEFRASMRDLAALEPGAILPTGLRPDSDLELYAVGQRRFTGSPGRVGQNLAVRVHERTRPDPEFLIEGERAHA